MPTSAKVSPREAARPLVGPSLRALSAVLVSLCLASCPSPQKAALRSLVPFDLGKHAEILKYSDDHGGFHGDGSTYLEVSIDAEAALGLGRETDHWKPLPLSADIAALENFLPKDFPLRTAEGLYYFCDLQPDMYPGRDEYARPVGQRSSYNFVVAILDAGLSRLFIFRLDT
jgi:hypothetical protein